MDPLKTRDSKMAHFDCTLMQYTYLMLPSVEARGLFSNTSTACSCSFKRTVLASTSFIKEEEEEAKTRSVKPLYAFLNVIQLLHQRRETNMTL